MRCIFPKRLFDSQKNKETTCSYKFSLKCSCIVLPALESLCACKNPLATRCIVSVNSLYRLCANWLPKIRSFSCLPLSLCFISGLCIVFVIFQPCLLRSRILVLSIFLVSVLSLYVTWSFAVLYSYSSFSIVIVYRTIVPVCRTF